MSVMEELYGEDGAPAAVVETQPTPEAAPAPSEVQPDPAPAPVETPAPTTPAEPQAPVLDAAGLLRALQEERDSRQAAQRERDELKRERAAQERKRQEAAAKAPDILQDPDGYIEWSERRQQAVVHQAVQRVQQAQLKQVETLSRAVLVRHIGEEKVVEIENFSRSAPPKAIDEAYASGDPYGWMHEKYEQAMKARKAEAALATLGDKPLEARIAEAVAAERAKWEAERGGGQPPGAATPPADARPRNPDGTFASPSQAQRHTPPSLSEVTGAVAVNGAERGSALEELYN